MRILEELRASWRRDRTVLAVPLALFALALFVYTRALDWGLPTGDETWAADALKPSAPLAVTYRNFAGHAWNNGWFWFKYPPFHAFLLSALYSPYLLWLWITGGVTHFSPAYPFGLRDPVESMTVLALIGRSTSAVMGAGSVLLAYACVLPNFGRRAAVAAGLVTTMAYPMVFYSQTTNVEVPYLFWLLVAVFGASRLVDGDQRPRWWVLLGLGAALSVSTKELSAGAIAGLPVAIVAASLASGRPVKDWLRGGILAALVFAAAIAVANNALFNPLGFSRRIGFLTQTLPREIALEYAPYYFPIELGGSRGAGVELAQLSVAAARLLASLGWPTLLLSIGGWIVALRRRPSWTLLLLAAAAGYYVVSVRAMLSLSLRYLLPLTVLSCMAAGIGLAELLRHGRARPLRVGLAGIAALYVFAYGWDVDRMMVGDGRYAASAWLADSGTTRRVEIYQSRTYLPHFPEGMAVNAVAYEERDVETFAARHPDLVVLSSSGLSGITVRYKQDWQDDSAEEEGYTPSQTSVSGQVMNYSRDANAELLRRLTAGELGYEEAASFVVEPWIPRPLIQSLNPEITIYRARSGAPDRPEAAKPESPPQGDSNVPAH